MYEHWNIDRKLWEFFNSNMFEKHHTTEFYWVSNHFNFSFSLHFSYVTKPLNYRNIRFSVSIILSKRFPMPCQTDKNISKEYCVNNNKTLTKYHEIIQFLNIKWICNFCISIYMLYENVSKSGFMKICIINMFMF